MVANRNRTITVEMQYFDFMLDLFSARTLLRNRIALSALLRVCAIHNYLASAQISWKKRHPKISSQNSKKNITPLTRCKPLDAHNRLTTQMLAIVLIILISRFLLMKRSTFVAINKCCLFFRSASRIFVRCD